MHDFVDSLPLLPLTTDLQHFDYFVEKNDFKKEVYEKDDDFCCDLIKQYARRIEKMDKELLTLEDIEDGKIIVTIKKSDLYLSCFAGLAKMEWNLHRISLKIPSVYVRLLLRQLVIFSFPDNVELAKANEVDFFKSIAEIPSQDFTEDNVFSVWLYARWVLYLDRTSRHPIITVKQTVSNPAQQVDQFLITADQHARCIVETRAFSKMAANFLQQLGSIPIDQVRVPTIECFVHINYMTATLNVWEEDITPDFKQSDIFIPMEWFINKTRHELFLANHAAGHFRSSKNLLKLLIDTKLDFSTIPPEILSYVKFDIEELNIYASSFGLLPEPILEIPETLTDLPTSDDSDSYVTAVTCGAIIPLNVVNDEEMKEQVIIGLEAKKEYTSHVLERLRIDTALRFLKEEYKPLALKVLPRRPAPPDDQFNNFVNEGPILFTQMCTIHAETLNRAFEANKANNVKFPERFSYPQEVADCIYRIYPRETYSLFFLLLGRAKQLENVFLTTHWEGFINLFLSLAGRQKAGNTAPSSLLVIECIAIKLQEAYTSISYNDVSSVTTMSEKVDRLLAQTSQNVLLKFYRCFLPALLNVGEVSLVRSKLSSNNIRDGICFPFFESLTHLLTATDDNAVDAKKKFYLDYVTILTKFSYDGASGNKLVFNLNDFLVTIQNICNPAAIKQLLNYTLQIYNRSIQPNENHFLLPSTKYRACYLLPDSYIHDTSEAIQWGTRSDVVHQILDVCLRAANRLCSNDPYVLRATGDYTFVINKFDSALRFYLNCILISTNHISQPLLYQREAIIDEIFWNKVITCLMELKRPTEAILTTQLSIEIFKIMPILPRILSISQGEDATTDLFPFIGDLALFEAISIAYGCNGRQDLQLEVAENVLTRAFYFYSSKNMQAHEGLRRKSHWIRILCSRIFNDCL